MDFESKPLEYWLGNPKALSRGVSLWVPIDTKKLCAETICYGVDENADLSNDEFDLREQELSNLGLECLLDSDEIKQVENDLKRQKKNYLQEDLYEAIDYYWKNDAFVNHKYA